MSNLEKHAEEEMRRAGLYDADSDYGGMIPEAVMKMVRALASEGHSGGSHALTMQIFNRVANFKTLTPITNDPTEWVNVADARQPDGETKPIFQNRRDCSLFSNDGGKTYYSVNDKDRTLKTAAQEKPCEGIKNGLRCSPCVNIGRDCIQHQSHCHVGVGYTCSCNPNG